MKRATLKPAAKKRRKAAEWDLCLYVAGNTARSNAALRNLRAICKENLGVRTHIEIIDLLKHPERASRDQILAIPTLVRRLPTPMRKFIGDLSERERVMMRLDLYIEGADHAGAQ